MSGTEFFLPTEQDLEISDEVRIFCSTAAIDSDDEGHQFVRVTDSEKRAQKVLVNAGEDRDGQTEIMKGNHRITERQM